LHNFGALNEQAFRVNPVNRAAIAAFLILPFSSESVYDSLNALAVGTPAILSIFHLG
jgi:hypothetical protein